MDKCITFAPRDLIDDYEDIARDFLKRICNLDYDECFISDESGVSDFAGCCIPETLDTEPESLKEAYAIGKQNMIQKVLNTYGVDITGKFYLLEVFDMIYQRKQTTIQ